MTAREAVREGERRLRAANVPDAAFDAAALLSEATGIPRLMLRVSDQTPTDAQLSRYRALLARREAREPLQYLIGTQPFMGFDFLVSPAALIPRFDTETLVAEALKSLKNGETVLDLCTGTGAIGLSLKKLMPALSVTLSDISADALALARQNAAALKAEAEFVPGDLFAPLAGRAFDMIVSNPPYIPTGALASLQAEVLREPALALDGGADGLTFYRKIIAEAPAHLRAGGRLILEIGDGQENAVKQLLTRDFTRIAAINDVNGLPRAVAAVKGDRTGA